MNVELKLWLKDLASDGIRRIDAISRSSMAGVTRSVEGASSAIRNIGNTMNGVRATVVNGASATASAIRGIGGAADEADRKLNKLNNSMSGGGGIFGKYAKGVFWGSLASEGVTSAVAGIKQQIGEALSSGMQQDALKMQFGVMGGVKGEQLFGELKKYVADSIYGTELYGNARTLMAFGVKPEETMEAIKRLSDISMGNKETLGGLTLAFAQTKSAGKLTGDDLRQYVAAGFNPLQVLSTNMGVKYETLRDKASNGEISSDMVWKAIVLATSAGGKFNNMTEKTAQTAYGKLQRLLGSIDDMKADIGVRAGPGISRVIDGITKSVERLPSSLNRLDPIIDKVADRFEQLYPKVEGIGRAALGVMEPIGKLLLSDELGKLARSAMGVTKSMLEILNPAIEGVAKTIQEGVLPILNWTVDRIKGEFETLKNASNTMQAWYKQYYPEGVGIKPTREQKMAVEQLLGQGEMKFRANRPEKGIGRGEWYNGVVAKKEILSKGGAENVSSPNVEAITGGGKKVINIYLNKPAVEKQIFNVSSMQEAASVSLNDFREQYLRVLQGAVAAL